MATEPKAPRGTRRFPFNIWSGPPSPSSSPPPSLRERHLVLREDGKKISYPSGLTLRLCKENLDGEIKHWMAPPRGQVKRPSPTMIAHARRGNLTGFLEGGMILRASDLEVESEEYLETYPDERIVDAETGALRLNMYREGTGKTEGTAGKAVEFQTDHLEEDDELPELKDRFAANLFYVALPVVVPTQQAETMHFAEEFLPSYHFWRRGPDVDPYESANYNVGRYIDLRNKYDPIKERKKQGIKASPKGPASRAPVQTNPVEEEEVGGEEYQEEEAETSGLSTPPIHLDTPSPPLATSFSKRSTPPRERPAAKRQRTASAPLLFSNKSEWVTTSPEFIKLEAEFEKQLRREGIQKVLNEIADYAPDEIAALRAKVGRSASRAPSLRKKRGLEHDAEFIRQPLTTVAHKLTRAAFGLPVSPIGKSDPLTRDNDKVDIEDDLDWDNGFEGSEWGASDEEVEVTSGGRAGSSSKSPMGSANKSSKGKEPAVAPPSKEQSPINWAAEYDAAEEFGILDKGFFKPFANLSSKRRSKGTSHQRPLKPVPCSIAHPASQNPVEFDDDSVGEIDDDVGVYTDYGGEGNFEYDEGDLSHLKNLCPISVEMPKYGMDAAVKHACTHIPELWPLCPYCKLDWSEWTYAERVEHLWDAEDSLLCVSERLRPEDRIGYRKYLFQPPETEIRRKTKPVGSVPRAAARAAAQASINPKDTRRSVEQPVQQALAKALKFAKTPPPALELAKARKARAATRRDATFRVQDDESDEPSPALKAPAKRKAQDHPEATFRPAKKGKATEADEPDSAPVIPVRKSTRKPKPTKAKIAGAADAKTKPAQAPKRKMAVVEIPSPTKPSASPRKLRSSKAATSPSMTKKGTGTGRPTKKAEPKIPVKPAKVTKKATGKVGKAKAAATAKAVKAG